MSINSRDYMSTNGHSHANSNGTSFGNGHKNSPFSVPNAGELIDYKRFYSIIKRHKKLIFFFVIIATGISYYLTYYYLKPVYKSEGTIVISPAQKQGSSSTNGELGDLISSTYGIGAGSSLAKEIEILRSRRLSREVAQQVMEMKRKPNGSLYPILWKNYPVDSTMISSKRLVGKIRGGLEIEQDKAEPEVIKISYESYSPYEANRLVNMVINAYSDLSTKERRAMAHSAVEFLGSEKQRVKSRLNEAETNLSNFMNKEKVVKLDTQTDELVKTLSDLESQRQALKVKLVAINSAIDNYQKQIASIRPGLSEQYSDAIAPTISGYQYRLADLETEKLLLVSKHPYLKRNPNSAPELKNINDQITVLKDEIKKLTGNLLKQSDKYIGFLGSTDGNIASELIDLHKKLLQLKIEKSQEEAQSKVLDERLASYKTAFDKVPANMIQLARLKRKVSMNEQLYTTISRQASDMALWEQTQSGLGQVVDYGNLPTKPVKPQKELIVFLSFILGFLFPIGFLLIKESLNTHINSVEKLRKRNLPVLSVIPDMKPIIKKTFSKRQKVDIHNKKVSSYLLTLLNTLSPVAESFRRLQSNVVYSQPDDVLNTILVTSSNKEEGKTTLLTNFAVALAEAGKKVLIIDCDFRRPGVHSVFGLPSTPGIMEILFDGLRPEEVIQHTVVPEIFVLSSGRIPPNPASINRSVKLRELINSLKEDYDHVLIDTPPYGLITDAAPLLKITDGVLLVVKFGQTREADLDHTIENLLRTRANIVGTAMMAFNHKKSTDYYFNNEYYRHGYKSYKSYHNKYKEKVKA
ncbi:MAG TPA: polysaccharide biosynthesis tyrosine autokinase [Balneolales bacterium]|nr:polysaccharide biosynthesis tyrosine autokinase [Balneolales bacterium]